MLGFKPTFGSLPVRGVFPLARSFDTVGFMVEDSLLLRRMWDLFHPVPRASTGTRVRLLAAAGLPPIDPAVDRVVRDFVDRLSPVEVSLPIFEQTWEVYRRIQGSEAYALHRDRLTRAPELFQPDVRDRLEAAEDIRGWQYVTAINDQRRLQAELLTVFDTVDILALPTTPITAPLLGTREVELDGHWVSVREALLSLTHPWSVLGWPAVSVPAGTVNGLPVGVQLVAGPGHDAALLDFVGQL